MTFTWVSPHPPSSNSNKTSHHLPIRQLNDNSSTETLQALCSCEPSVAFLLSHASLLSRQGHVASDDP
jgi:hypothetical protein